MPKLKSPPWPLVSKWLQKLSRASSCTGIRIIILCFLRVLRPQHIKPGTTLEKWVSLYLTNSEIDLWQSLWTAPSDSCIALIELSRTEGDDDENGGSILFTSGSEPSWTKPISQASLTCAKTLNAQERGGTADFNRGFRTALFQLWGVTCERALRAQICRHAPNNWGLYIESSQR